ncbi:MAG: polyribonucleotide nucleotidyltransferase [Bacilli bacterium]|nr:polyribonucleotide nucleotidyltransferase [Bacilli bacterium]
MSKEVFTLDFYGKKLVVENGEIATQADGSVFVRFNDTAVLCAVCGAKEAKLGQDFFPLTVNYFERQYAAGKIPGSFLRREGRQSTRETLISRLIDRPIRPMFPEGYVNETQITCTVMSSDPDACPDMTAMFGASLALCVSDIPFEGPIAGVHVGRVNGQFIINPTVEEMAQSDLDLSVAGTEVAINMVEAGAQELSEDEMLDALMFGHEAVKKLCAFQKEIAAKVGKQKRELNIYHIDEEFAAKCRNYIAPGQSETTENRIIKAVSIYDKLERQNTIDALEQEVITLVDQANWLTGEKYETMQLHDLAVNEAKEVLETVVRDEVRRLITVDKVRPDGRKTDEIRPLEAQVHLLPRAHGSALFRRGQTQVLSACTLGSLDDAQILDNITGDTTKRWMHHYNFPPFSVGELGRMGTPGRREIGHGNLGERALSYVIPSEEEFPYTIRCVADVCESNGSSSQASICASCMALMDAGVPIKAPVSGIAMGLITSGPLDGNHPYTILTDIQGLEDHLGDMDFKVAGTPNGITALQMDIKIRGITKEILKEALYQAKPARAQILSVMLGAISEPRTELSEYALKMKRFNIEPDKIREVIGSQGKVINGIIDECDNDVKIDINDDGRVILYSVHYETIEKAYNMIMSIAKVPQVGEIYEGKVVRVETYGAFVNLFGNTDALCHISKLGWGRVEKVEDVCKVGDTLKVIITGIDAQGRVDVSHRDLLEKPEGYVEKPERPKKPFHKNNH